MGNSMEPLIKATARLEICLSHKSKYTTGDIVVFVQKSSYVAHRIISVQRKGKTAYFTLKGDNNSKTDGIFSAQQMVGRVDIIVQNGHSIDLRHWKHKFLRYCFVLYSLLNRYTPIMRLSSAIRHSKILRAGYRSLIYT